MQITTTETPKHYQNKYHSYAFSLRNQSSRLAQIDAKAGEGFEQALVKHKHSILGESHLRRFVEFAKANNKQQQSRLIEEEATDYFTALIELFRNLREGDQDLSDFTVTSIETLLFENRALLREVAEDLKYNEKYSAFLGRLLSQVSSRNIGDGMGLCSDRSRVGFWSALRVLSMVYAELESPTYVQDKMGLLHQIIELAPLINTQYSHFRECYLSLLPYTLKHQWLAEEFFKQKGADHLIQIVRDISTSDVSCCYYGLMSLLTLAFVPEFLDEYVACPKKRVLRLIQQVATEAGAEKTTRLFIKIVEVIRHNPKCIQMIITEKIPDKLDKLSRLNYKGEHIKQELQRLLIELADHQPKLLNSFEKYCYEVQTKNLQWSSIHSEQFWRENANKFQADDYLVIKQLLLYSHGLVTRRKLKGLLSSTRQQNAIIAIHDLAEFARFYPNGRKLLKSLKIKDAIMKLAKGESKLIRNKAVEVLPKILIEKWDSI